jgi:hypothetical protein
LRTGIGQSFLMDSSRRILLFSTPPFEKPSILSASFQVLQDIFSGMSADGIPRKT